MYITFGQILLMFFLLCFVVITVFISIALYKLIMTLKSVNEIIDKNKDSINLSAKSISGILKTVDGVGGKVFSKVDETEEAINENIPKYMSYIVAAISFVISLLNVFKQKKDND